MKSPKLSYFDRSYGRRVEGRRFDIGRVVMSENMNSYFDTLTGPQKTELLKKHYLNDPSVVVFESDHETNEEGITSGFGLVVTTHTIDPSKSKFDGKNNVLVHTRLDKEDGNWTEITFLCEYGMCFNTCQYD